MIRLRSSSIKLWNSRNTITMNFLRTFQRLNADGQSLTLNLRKRMVADGTKSPSYPGELTLVAIYNRHINTHRYLFKSFFFLFVINLYWSLTIRSPDNAKIKQKMLFASSRDALKRSLTGVGVEIQGSDYSEVSREAGNVTSCLSLWSVELIKASFVSVWEGKPQFLNCVSLFAFPCRDRFLSLHYCLFLYFATPLLSIRGTNSSPLVPNI